MPPEDLPPSGFAQRRLPVDRLEEGTLLYRSHRQDHSPLHFSRGHTGNRFDDPDARFGVCYLATTPAGAFAEAFLRPPGPTYLGEQDLIDRMLAEMALTRDLALVRFHGAGLHQLGATARVSSGPHATSQRWAAAIHAHPDRHDGIIYRVRHDDEQFGVALFERSKDALTECTTEQWLYHPALPAMLDRYEVGVGP